MRFKNSKTMINNLSVVETNSIGKNTTISEFCVIRQNVKIGNNVFIHPNVIINEGVEIEDGVEIFPGALIGKEPKGAGATARKLEFEKKIKIGANTSIGPNAIIYYDVIIGANCLLGDAVAIREKCRIGIKCIIGRHVSLLYNVVIDDETRIMTNSHISGNSVIGKNVFISVGVNSMNDNDFGENGYHEKVIGQNIGDNVKIGGGATLLPNIKIGKNAVIASGAVVTRNVEGNSLVMGVPAKHQKFVNKND